MIKNFKKTPQIMSIISINKTEFSVYVSKLQKQRLHFRIDIVYKRFKEIDWINFKKSYG